METPYFEELANFSHVHVDMWCGFAPCGQVRFWQPKRPHLERRDVVWQSPLIMGQKIADFSKMAIFDFFLPFMGPKVVFLVKKTVFWGVFWTGCEGPDLKQRKGVT